MIALVTRRTLQTLIVVFLLVTFTFIAIRLIPGNPLESDKATSSEVMKRMAEPFGFNRPYVTQYLLYWKNLLFKGDLGLSTTLLGRSVSEIISTSFPVSLMLGLTSLIIGVFVGIPLGVIAAMNKNGWIDYLSMVLAMAGICVPAFVLGPVLQLTVARQFDSISAAGWSRPGDLILPAITLSVGVAAYLARLSRGGMLDILSQDFIRTAHAKGLPLKTIIFKHALKPSLLPAITYLGPAFAAIITGSFVVEIIFQVPGMGQHFVNAVISKDPFLLQGLVLFYGLIMGGANLIVDIVIAFLNPRLRETA